MVLCFSPEGISISLKSNLGSKVFRTGKQYLAVFSSTNATQVVQDPSKTSPSSFSQASFPDKMVESDNAISSIVRFTIHGGDQPTKPPLYEQTWI